MKAFFLICGVALLLPMAASGQVVVNQAALDQLAGIVAAPAAAPAIAPPAVHHVVHRLAHKPAGKKLVVAAVRPAIAPAIPAVAAPAPVTPVVAKPAPPPAPKPAPPPVAGIDFAAGSSALPADAAAALQPICTAAGTDGIVSVNATSQGDASTAMRLSMDRAFAIRGALTACGVPAAHILPRALGNVAGKNPDETQVSLSP